MADKFLQTGKNFIKFVNASPSPFHAVEEIICRLKTAGYVEIHEREKYDITNKGKYFFTRNKSSIIAFAVGGKYAKGNGFNIVAAHTDSPCLKLKPVSESENAGYVSVGVQCYGGGLWHTWFDRDLKLAGRVLYKNKDKKVAHRLIHIDKPILRIPTLAIHLQRGVNTDGFKFNLEKELYPIMGTTDKCGKRETAVSHADQINDYTQGSKHSEAILACIAHDLNCDASDILDFELCLADFTPAAVGGLKDEFLFAPRLDNLMSCYTGLEALINATTDECLSKESNIQMLCCFDHEEIGSQSAYGAGSNLLRQTISRIAKATCAEDFEMTVARSILISSDMAHAVHPNYGDKHEKNHRPQLHHGPVIKFNANQRYATTAVTAYVLRALAEKRKIPIQDFVVKNDSGCGSTIGPMLSASLGMRTVDIGSPQLSMHSIREMGGVDDVTHSIDLFTAFYEEFSTIEPDFVIE